MFLFFFLIGKVFYALSVTHGIYSRFYTLQYSNIICYLIFNKLYWTQIDTQLVQRIEKQQEMWLNDWECNKLIIRFNLYGDIKLMDEENANENSFQKFSLADQLTFLDYKLMALINQCYVSR